MAAAALTSLCVSQPELVECFPKVRPEVLRQDLTQVCSRRPQAAYDEAFRRARDQPEEFWGEQAENIVWTRRWDRVLDATDPVHPKWFPGGELNVCYNAVDRHVDAGFGDHTAIIYDSPVTNTIQHMSYRQFQEQVSRFAGFLSKDGVQKGDRMLIYMPVSRFAGVLSKHGVQKGDRVLIYMPMTPHAMVAMLASARLGAIHSLVFGGFGGKELATRVGHAKPKVIVTASCGVEPSRIVQYQPMVQEALLLSGHQPAKVILYNRPTFSVSLPSDLWCCWDEEMAAARSHDCVPVDAMFPLYLLYTSGTTGLPKSIRLSSKETQVQSPGLDPDMHPDVVPLGKALNTYFPPQFFRAVVRPSGGHAVMLYWSMWNIYGIKPQEVWWAASDLGWVVGHSYICYAPLLHGNTTVMYEGKPVGTPDAGAFFRVMSQHQTAGMFTAPTAIRAIRKEDPNAELAKQYPLTHLRNFYVAGEHCDSETLHWTREVMGVPVLDHWGQDQHWTREVMGVPVLDHWWQTETGSSITASHMGLGDEGYPTPGVSGKPSLTKASGY
ncbi:Acyl-CoA synthetase short-chain member 3, mitochondrial [Branchiostoma belcheri]|nr:Acyl-CoA synthetase short-chain member 3, mitochondrial [Branchiostoma belcheri]